ncbi:hypothetical protein J6524_25655 [Bradyrhizobium sp. WSM 1738]|jgi:hypothetical protein|uniref:hypothetical protein n=1 Tax=Bradyrhizobium hereditatis TaxID=2821405 RepID=UPI001CE30D4D|nr:hypothetical protein [Bradyrhizobium hereditatis]MCA6118236.1 hypothetical protein [Bradyrhizobium hereditatis]
MRDRLMSVVDSDIDWHDGILVDIRLSGLAGEVQELALVIDLYPDNDPNSKRRRYLCIGAKLSRFLLSGDVARLLKNRSVGNICSMRVEFTADSEILVIDLFGGMIEAEAASFQLTETSA